MIKLDDLFAKASYKKFRFPFRGSITVEDLWDLTVDQLNQVYLSLRASKKEDEGGLIETHTNESEYVDDRMAIVKYIFDLKVADKKSQQDAAKKRQEKNRILEIIAAKQDQALGEKSVDELTALLNSLEG